jgi:CBS domain-containing protein
MNLAASDVMTQTVVSVSESLSVKELIDLLNENTITGVPVVDEEGLLVGVISITDLLAANFSDDEFGLADFHKSPSMDGLAELHGLLTPDEAIEPYLVSQLMSRKSITATESESIGAMSKTLVTNRIHRLIIVRERRPVGIVSVGDILRTLSSLTEP